jgi:hypothetical protein
MVSPIRVKIGVIRREIDMDALLPIIIQAVTGIIGGLGVGAALKNAAMSMVTKVISGLVGGVLGGQILANMMTDAGALSDAVGGVGGGAILTAIVGMVMSNMGKTA